MGKENEERVEEKIEEVKESQNEREKGNKIIIVSLVLIVLIAIGACVYLLLKGKVEEEKEPQKVSNFIEKNDLETNTEKKEDETPKEDNTNENKSANQNENGNNGVKEESKKEYKSKDGKYTFRIVDRSELKPADDADIGARTAPYYAYLNDHPVGIETISDDGKGVYYTYKGWFYEIAGSNGVVSIVVDSRDNTLVVCPYAKPEHAVADADEVYYLFSSGIDGLSGGLTALNINAGEFFIRYTNSPEGANLLYTKDWKELGWIGTPQYDNEGVYAFNNYYLDGAEFKYDASGKNLSEKNNKGLKIVVDSPNGPITLDFDKIEYDLIAKVDGYKANVELRIDSNCGVGSSSSVTKKSLGISEISKVISKLREAKKVEWAPTSRECVLYNFSVGKDLVAFEADDPTVMLVGINGDGFAFHYDESVIDFFKSL